LWWFVAKPYNHFSILYSFLYDVNRSKSSKLLRYIQYVAAGEYIGELYEYLRYRYFWISKILSCTSMTSTTSFWQRLNWILLTTTPDRNFTNDSSYFSVFWFLFCAIITRTSFFMDHDGVLVWYDTECHSGSAKIFHQNGLCKIRTTTTLYTSNTTISLR